MKPQRSISFILISFILISCSQATAVSPDINPSSTQLISTATPDLVTATPEVVSENTPTPFFNFEIVNAEVISKDDTKYKSFLRPGVNIKVLLLNLDTSLLAEHQLVPEAFCSPCVGWDNTGMMDGIYTVIVLHFYSSSLIAGENTIAINAYGIKKETVVNWDPSSGDIVLGSSVNPQGEFKIIVAEIVTKDDIEYVHLLRPGVNIKILLSNLDTGLLSEDQLIPENFCNTCAGWTNAGLENGYNVVILHFYSSNLNAGENTITINAYGDQKETVVNWDPSSDGVFQGTIVNPLGNFEIVNAEVLSKDSTKYAKVIFPGVNVKVVLSNIDLGAMPEDQLKPVRFCVTCFGWDNFGIENGNSVVVLHFINLKTGKNVIEIIAYGVLREVIIDYDPFIHLIK